MAPPQRRPAGFPAGRLYNKRPPFTDTFFWENGEDSSLLPEGFCREPVGRQTPSPGRKPWERMTNEWIRPAKGAGVSPLAGLKRAWFVLRTQGFRPGLRVCRPTG